MKLLLFWRLPMLIFTIAVLIWGLNKSGIDFMAYLTFWGFAAITFYFLLSIFNSGIMTVLLQELSSSFAYLITTGYWIFGCNIATTPFSFFNIAFHILNTIIMLVDTIITRYTYIPKHLLYILGFGLVYAIFNLIYVKITGSPLYSLISWNNIETFGWLVVCALVLIVTFTLGMTISFVSRRILKSKT